MTQASLVCPVAKVDIKDLLKSDASPPPPLSVPIQPASFPRATSVASSCSTFNPLPSPSSTSRTHQYSAPPNPYSYHQRQDSRQHPAQPSQSSATVHSVHQHDQKPDLASDSTNPNKRSHPSDEQIARSPPAKRATQWSPGEDAKVIRLRGKRMKWEDICKEIPGRSAIACRLHYQNYLEKRGEWDEEKRNKLARVYDRLKEGLWNPIAIELGVPWRAAEAMHWAIGEEGMARRANATPFAIAAARTEPHESSNGCGRVAQRERMLESTTVFEGRDLSTLSSPFVSVNGHGSGNGNGNCHVLGSTPGASAAHFGVPPPRPTPSGSGSASAAHMHIAPIKEEFSYTGYEDTTEYAEDGDDEGESRRKKRRSGEMRLPGIAELDGEIQAFHKEGWVKVEREEGRRGSGSGGSFSSG